jgi:hypothetical protein
MSLVWFAEGKIGRRTSISLAKDMVPAVERNSTVKRDLIELVQSGVENAW